MLAGRVISKPKKQICLDLGYKALASEMPHPRLHFLNLDAGELINHSEEHLVLGCSHADRLSAGDLIYALPTHICPTMALHEEVYVVEDGKIKATWKVEARRRMYPL